MSKITKGFLLLSFLCSLLFLIRFNQTGELLGFGLIWNLFLAWVPLGFALLAKRSITHKPTSLILLFCWLLFFPNAPYIITDLVHLQHLTPHLWWYDSLGIFLTALTGLLLGIYSIQKVHHVLYAYYGKINSWLLVLSSMMLSGFGIYLGRFLRLNSWEIVTDPLHLISTCLNSIQHPLAQKTTLLFGFVLFVLYWVFFFLTHKQNEFE